MDEFDVKVIEQTGNIVSGDGNRLMTPFGAISTAATTSATVIRTLLKSR